MKTNNLLLLGAIGAAVWYFTMRKPSRAEQTKWLMNWVTANAGSPNDISVLSSVLSQMTDAEVADVYAYLHDYSSAASVPAELRQRIILISAKYNIFT